MPDNSLRFTGEWPPVELWAEQPNWEYALDEEDVQGQDETTLRPAADSSVVGPDTTGPSSVGATVGAEDSVTSPPSARYERILRAGVSLSAHRRSP